MLRGRRPSAPAAAPRMADVSAVLSTVVANVASGGFDAGHDARLDSQRCRGRRYAFDSHEAHPAVYDAKRAAEPFCSAVNRWLPLEWFEQARTGPGAARAAGAAGAPPATDDNSRGLSSA